MNIEQALQNDEIKSDVTSSIKEAVEIALEIESKQQEIKNIATVLKEDYEIPTAEFNKVVGAIVKANLEEQIEKLQMVERVVGIVKGE